MKPSNLLIHPDGRLLLADFGIARPIVRPLARTDHPLQVPDAGSLRASHAPSASRTPSTPDLEFDDPALTQTGVPVGTPPYMAPEQIRGEAVSAATDIYALGVLAYTLLGGRPPYDGGQTGDLLRRQLVEAPWSLCSLRPDLPPSVEEAVLWALAKRPADRPTTAGQFVQVLEAAGQGMAPSDGMWMPSSSASPPAAPSSLLERVRTERVGLPVHDAPTLDGAGPSTIPGDLPPASPPLWPLVSPADVSLMSPSRPLPALRRHGHAGRALGRAGALAAVALGMLGVLGVLVLAPLLWALASGWAASSGLSGGHTGPARIVPTATATVTPVPTPTPVANGLTVAPPSVRLGCGTKAKSIAVMLRNLGPEPTEWSASAPFLGGVSVSPSRGGPLASGHSVTITVTNTSIVAGHQGTITFTPTAAHAGRPASLTYTTQPCY